MPNVRRNLLAAAGNADAGLDLQFLGYVGDNNSDTNKTVSSADLGTPHADRVVVVAISGSNGHRATAVTIGGVSATLAAGDSDGTIESQIWYAEVPTGATGDIVTTGFGGDRYSFCWYSFNTSTPTPIDTDVQSSGSSGDASTTIDSSAGGAIIYALGSRTDSDVDDPTWSGTSTPVEDQLQTYNSSGRFGFTGSMEVESGDDVTGGTFEVPNVGDDWSITVVSWDP